MTIRMDRNKFDSLTDDAVGHACFEPMVPVYQAGMRGRVGKAAVEYRTEFHKLLTRGQRALFMFFTYYDHAIRSPDEFVRISGHYLSAQIFGAVIKGIAFFRDDSMIELLSAVEQTLSDKGQSQKKISELYHQFAEIAPNTLSLIGAHIKENRAEFICLE
ncbi:MAG TPA: hypothetical protein DEQ02_09575 [Ruminococcaceae bacterium]|nr:hypothetical protein [Oscillospiraceae bacterium]